ncbi:branched-chain amino acid transport system permease protein [Nitrobacteraceae bacterium AZCC 2161]
MKGAIEILVRHRAPIILGCCLALLVTVGVLTDFRQHLQLTLTEMLLRMTIVVGIYIFVGNSGIVSFGHIAFVCIGAYAAGWATADPEWKQLMLTGLPSFLQDKQYPFLVAQAGAMLLPAVVALGSGIAILRLRGIAASIATFAFLIIVQRFYSNWDSVTAGAGSLARLPTIVDPWIGLAFALGAIGAAYLFQISHWGLMLRASRDDDVAAKASGVRIVRQRLIAFVLSAAIVGSGGGLYAQFLGNITVDEFYLEMTFVTLSMLVVGGIGSLSGAVVGVVVVTFVVEILRTLEQGVSLGSISFLLPAGTQEIGLGVVMALILILRPNGLTRSRELLESRGRN